MNIRPLKRENLYEKIVHQIMSLIKNKHFSNGEKLPGEETLAKSFDVSRSIIRESLKALELIDVIRSEPGVGNFITNNALASINQFELTNMMKDRKNSIDLMEVRCFMEKESAYYAAKRGTEEEIEELRQIIEETRELILNQKYNFDNGLKFHMKIADMTSNNILKKILFNISDELIAQRKELLFRHMNTEELMYELKEHIQIFNYIKDGNAYAAREAMETHLFRALNILKNAQ